MENLQNEASVAVWDLYVIRHCNASGGDFCDCAAHHFDCLTSPLNFSRTDSVMYMMSASSLAVERFSNQNLLS